MSLCIVCVNAADYCGRGRDYVARLHDMVRRNLPAGYPGRFICFADSMEPMDGVELRPLPVPSLKGWYHKLSLMKPGVFEDGDRILYFDLDTLITGRLDEIVAYDRGFAILADFLDPRFWQSSVMAWTAGFGAHIWQSFVRAGYPDVPGGDQAWIMQHQDHAIKLQDRFPGAFVSYKKSGGALPDKASVVCFHGSPRPHEVTTGWVPEVWKIGGLTRAEMDTICNTENERLFANVRENVKRDLPRVQIEPANEEHAVLVGGGPSLVDTLDELRWRYSEGQHIWALNGSAAWLEEHGILPHAHVIVDARWDNVQFVAKPIGDATYLLASQCDPVLFERLYRHDVMLWHPNLPGIDKLLSDEPPGPITLIGGGSTVGLNAIQLADCLGYRKIHLYGFDSSVRQEFRPYRHDDSLAALLYDPNYNVTHHAYAQASNDADLIVDVMTADGSKFRAAPWMTKQADEFCTLAAAMAERDFVITVHGSGLLPHLARQMMLNPPVTAADIRAAEILKRIPEGPVIGAEIGVFTGELSRRLLAREDLTLIMVDSWAGNGLDYRDKDDWHAKLSESQQDEYRRAATNAVAFAGGRAEVTFMTSLAAAKYVSRCLDFVFIDADHSYEGCRDDIAAWLPKLKPGGLLAGHDYGNRTEFPHFDVDRAVNEFVTTSGLTLEIGSNFCWFVRLPAAMTKAA